MFSKLNKQVLDQYGVCLTLHNHFRTTSAHYSLYISRNARPHDSLIKDKNGKLMFGHGDHLLEPQGLGERK